MYLKKTQLEIRLSSDLLGYCLITSLSGGLNPSAVAGKPSVTRFTQSNYTELNDSGIPRAAVKKIEATSPMLEEIKYLINAFILL
jgi:hypothetical protein